MTDVTIWYDSYDVTVRTNSDPLFKNKVYMGSGANGVILLDKKEAAEVGRALIEAAGE